MINVINNFVLPLSHFLQVRVSASHETKLSKGGLVGYGAASNPAFASEERTIVTEYTGDFQREITGGSFECTTNDCGNSKFAHQLI